MPRESICVLEFILGREGVLLLYDIIALFSTFLECYRFWVALVGVFSSFF